MVAVTIDPSGRIEGYRHILYHPRVRIVCFNLYSEKSSYVTYRHYLCDAVFLAGLEGEEELLKELEVALSAYPVSSPRQNCLFQSVSAAAFRVFR